jgi:60 kDa SS-A/Ro ribonucleoprotein
VCRTGTHIMHFVKYREALGGGWGRGMKTCIQRWFEARTPEQRRQLAYQVVKYPSRDGWSQRDLIRLSHPYPNGYGEHYGHLLRYIAKGPQALVDLHGVVGSGTSPDWAEFLGAVELIRAEWKTMPITEVCSLIAEYTIPREALPTELLNVVYVWEAMLPTMPMTAMLRNLGKMGSLGLLTVGSTGEDTVTAALGSSEKIHASRVHPVQILSTMKIYASGKGIKGSLTWTPNKRIVSALDEAFYTSFKNVSPSNKRIRLAVDISASMDGSKIAGMEHLSAREGAAAMALVTMAVEPRADVVAYSTTMQKLDINPQRDRLNDVVNKMRALPFGGTICSLPMMDALQESDLDIEAFVSYTDSETYNGYSGWGSGYVSTSYGARSRERVEIPTVSVALKDYRQRSGLDTRHAVVAMAVNDLTLADPNDPRELDLVGFDASTPAVLSSFIAGDL